MGVVNDIGVGGARAWKVFSFFIRGLSILMKDLYRFPPSFFPLPFFFLFFSFEFLNSFGFSGGTPSFFLTAGSIVLMRCKFSFPFILPVFLFLPFPPPSFFYSPYQDIQRNNIPAVAEPKERFGSLPQKREDGNKGQLSIEKLCTTALHRASFPMKTPLNHSEAGKKIPLTPVLALPPFLDLLNAYPMQLTMLK